MARKQRPVKGPIKMDLGKIPDTTLSEVMEAGKVKKAMPTWKEIGSAFGEKAVLDKQINLDPATREGRSNRGKLLDMMMPAWGVEANAGTKRNDAIETEVLYDDQGRQQKAASAFAQDMADSRGLHASKRLHFTGGWPEFDKNGKVIR